MAWSYSGNPSDSEKDAIRYIVGDTSEDDGFVQDEEIEYALNLHSNIYAAAAMVASNLSNHFAMQAEQTKVGPITEVYTKRSERYATIASKLEIKATKSETLNIVCGGVTTSDACSASFFVGMHDFVDSCTDD